MGETAMTTIRVVFAVLAFSALIAARPSVAEIYRPWCVQYHGSRSGATSCAFTSFEQCMMTARGAGASCVQNPWYSWSGDRGPGYGAKDRSERAGWR